MFSLKASILFFIAFHLAAPLGAVPDCGVCATPAGGVFRAQASSTISAKGQKTILYVRLNYPDDPAEPITQSGAEALMSEVSGWFRRHSHGQFWTEATVTPLLQLPAPKSYYFPTNENGSAAWRAHDLLANGQTVALAAGFDAAEYDLVLLRLNGQLQSFANMGRPGAWMFTSHPATTIHEIGHNLGLHHANAWRGKHNGPGENVEYGDTFDIMGNPSYHAQAGLNAINKAALGWFHPSNVVEITASGIYRLHAHDVENLDSSRAYTLRVRKDSERDYWIEKRVFDIYEHMEKSGVLVYWDDWTGSNTGTHLLDPTSDPGESLPIGGALVDEAAALRIVPITMSEDRSYVDIAVIFGNGRLNLLPGMLHFSGELGRIYRAETSTDFRSWSEVATLSGARGEWFVPVEKGAAMSFYRVVEISLFK